MKKHKILILQRQRYMCPHSRQGCVCPHLCSVAHSFQPHTPSPPNCLLASLATVIEMAETNTASDRSLNVFQTTGITGANLISFLLNLGVVAATQRGLFGGKDNAQISDEHPTLVTPAG